MSDRLTQPFRAIPDKGAGNAQLAINFLSGVKGHSKLILTFGDYHG